MMQNNFLSYVYEAKYESSELRGIDSTRPWNLAEVILKFSGKDRILLDIGCGTAFKIIPLTEQFFSIVGLEPNEEMRKKAQQHAYGISNFNLVGGFSQQIPLANESFDLVTNILAPYDLKEMARVLKPHGLLVMETIGERDKHALKLAFGKDRGRWRGQLTELPADGVSQRIGSELGQYFSEVICLQNGRWETKYTWQQLILLLQQTPTIRNFDLKKDHSCLEVFWKKMLEKNRYLSGNTEY